MISRELAARLVEEVRKYTDCNIIIVNQNGIIIASSDPSRIGKYHQSAHDLIQGTQESVEVERDNLMPGVKAGISMIIRMNGVREGAVGVSGDPKEIRTAALTIKASLEVMLDYLSNENTMSRNISTQDRFLNCLIGRNPVRAEELRDLAGRLGYAENLMRIPVLLVLPASVHAKADPAGMLSILRSTNESSVQDMLFVMEEGHLLIFKTIRMSESLMIDYKPLLSEYLRPLLSQQDGIRVYIGSFQDHLEDYRYGYQHCRWLEEHKADSFTGIYDHTGEYLQEFIPDEELVHLFQGIRQAIPPGRELKTGKMLAALNRSNYSFPEASDALYIHKNTLVYHYNKMKEAWGVDPVRSSRDRSLVQAIRLYLERKKDQ